jgi:uncharacterized membrane-anchored protein
VTLPRKAAFALVAAVQLAVPLSSIVVHERTLEQGHPWRFRTGPVDPIDAFRGRYVALAFPVANEVVDLPADAQVGDRLFGVLEPDADGFARFARFERRLPDQDAVGVSVAWVDDRGRGSVRVPFDVYYLPEDLEPEATALQRASGRGTAWAVVRVRDGRAVIEDVVVDGVPLRESIEGRGRR